MSMTTTQVSFLLQEPRISFIDYQLTVIIYIPAVCAQWLQKALHSDYSDDTMLTCCHRWDLKRDANDPFKILNGYE